MGTLTSVSVPKLLSLTGCASAILHGPATGAEQPCGSPATDLPGSGGSTHR